MGADPVQYAELPSPTDTTCILAKYDCDQELYFPWSPFLQENPSGCARDQVTEENHREAYWRKSLPPWVGRSAVLQSSQPRSAPCSLWAKSALSHTIPFNRMGYTDCMSLATWFSCDAAAGLLQVAR